MDLLDAIFTRGALGKFTGEPIEEEDLKLILKAGFQALQPIIMNQGEYIVIRDKGKY